MVKIAAGLIIAFFFGLAGLPYWFYVVFVTFMLIVESI